MQWPAKKATLLLQYRKELRGFEDMNQLEYLKGIGNKFSGSFSQWFYIKKLINTPQGKLLNLNNCGFQKIMKLPLMNIFIARKILALRKKKKVFKARWEILAIRAITPAYYSLLKNHIYINDLKKTNLKLKLQNIISFKETSSSKISLKTKTQIQFFEKFKINLLYQKTVNIDKAPETSNLFLASLNYKDSLGNQIIIGDFSFLLGEEIVFGSPFNFGVTIYTKGLKNKSSRLKSQTSFTTEHILRGVGGEIKIKNHKLTLLFSHREYPDRISTNYNWYASTVSTVSPDSLRFDRIVKNNFQQETIGSFIWSVSNKHNKLGLGLSSFYYKKPILIFRDEKNIFAGHNLTMANLFYVFQFKRLIFFGETASSIYNKLIKREQTYHKQLNIKPAFSGGLKTEWNRLKLAVHYNRIKSGYITPLSETKSNKENNHELNYQLSFKIKKGMLISTQLEIPNLKLDGASYNFEWSYKVGKYRLKTQIGLNENNGFISKNIQLKFCYTPVSNFYLMTTLNLEQDLQADKINNYLSLGIVYNNHKNLKIICQWINFGESSTEKALFAYKYHLEGWYNMPERLSGVGQNIFLMAEYEFADSFKMGLLFNQKEFQKREENKKELNREFSLAITLKF